MAEYFQIMEEGSTPSPLPSGAAEAATPRPILNVSFGLQPIKTCRGSSLLSTLQ